MLKVIIPLIISISLGGAVARGLVYIHITLERSLGLGIAVTIILLFAYRILKYIIDYKMDACIISPSDVIIIDQTGFFKRRIRTIEASKIKTVSTLENSMIRSIFNNGKLIFLTDGGDNKDGEIVIDYIYNSLKKREIVDTILKGESLDGQA